MSWMVCLPARVQRSLAIAGFASLLGVSAAIAAGPDGGEVAPNALQAQLEPIWTSPLTTDPKSTSQRLGFSPGSWAEAPDGAVVLLGSMVGPGREERLMLRHAERAGPEAAIPFASPTSEPEGLQRPASLLGGRLKPNLDRAFGTMAIGGNGGTWLGGRINDFSDIGSSPHSDAYLAKLDVTGKVAWDRAYTDGAELSVSSIVPMDGGGVVVAGSGRDNSWLARIGPDGARVAEWRFGSGKGVALAPLPGGRVVVAGFNEGGVTASAANQYEAAQVATQAGTYRDDVSVWMLDATGDPQGPMPIHQGISQGSPYNGPGNHAGTITIAAAGEAAYIATNWFGDPEPTGVEVTRIGSNGTVSWQRHLRETVAPMDARRVHSCWPALTALPNGDALVACALNSQVQVYRLDATTGKVAFARLAPPPCQRGGYASSVSLLTQRNGTVLALGSGMGNDGDAGCTWMARLSLKAGPIP